MILDGLGFLCAHLHLFEEFLCGKAPEHLIGEGVKPEYLMSLPKANLVGPPL